MTMMPMPGERGKQGDHGQAGDQGLKGETGQTGETGKIGETGHRGNRGDTGETGLTGEIGATGYRGRTGDTGAPGSKGEKGEKGAPILTRLQTLVMFVFVVAAFALVAWRTQVNSDNFQKGLAERQYESCLGGQAILGQFDRFLNDMAAIEEKGTKPGSPTYDATATPTRLERVAAYRAAMIELSDCVKP